MNTKLLPLIDREGFVFYRSFYEAIRELPESEQLAIYNAITEYSFTLEEPKLEGIAKTIWILIKPQIEANNRRYLNWKKSKTEAKKKQNRSKTGTKEKEKEKEKEKVNNNIIDKSIIKTESFWNDDINKMQEIIKHTIENNNMFYKPWKQERNRIRNILTWKDFGEVCEKSNMTREQFVIEIINLASKLQYAKSINNAVDLYENYAAVYNKALKMKNDILQPKRLIW